MNLTLCCIDCANVPLAERALRRSQAAFLFARALFFSDAMVSMPGVDWIEIPRIGNREEYSRFVVKSLNQHIETSHVLLIQWDGFVANPAAWTDEFLEYDYIGAPWGFHQDEYRVGNGGFSLRSKRLLDALADPEIVDIDPEDEAICRRYRPLLEQRYGIRFAPESLAARFSYETTYPDGVPFGFHGLFNMWMHLREDEFDDFLGLLTPAILRSPQLLQLGRNYKDLGRRREATAILKRRLAVLPDDRDCQRMLRELEPRPAAVTAPASRNAPCPCGSGKRYKECCGALSAAPSPPIPKANTPSPDDLFQEAMRRHQAGELSTAQALYQQVLKLVPRHAMAMHYLGVVQMQFDKLDEAERLMRGSLELEAGIPDFHNNLGLCLRAQHRLEDAVPCYRKALELRSDYAVGHNNLGLDLQQLGQVDEARRRFEEAIRLQPDFAEAHWNLGLVLLLKEDFAQGWREYEWRLRCPQFTRGAKPPAGIPIWQGEPLQGKRILILREQGAGDNFQFVRLTPLLAGRGAQVLLETTPDQSALLCRAAGISACVGKGDGTPREADYCIPMLSLPHRLGVDPRDLPQAAPYLSVDAELREEWRQRLAHVPGFRVGLVWAGNPAHANDYNRSCPLDALADLFDLPGISWLSLQKGEAAGQLKALPDGKVIDLGSGLASYSDTAAVMANLDLIVAVDTSVAHLAGALNRPCWVMLPFAPDFRWLLEREDSPWYPSIRLFRQRSIGDWREVVGRIRQALALRAAPSDAH